jgi:hypothetical protein
MFIQALEAFIQSSLFPATLLAATAAARAGGETPKVELLQDGSYRVRSHHTLKSGGQRGLILEIQPLDEETWQHLQGVALSGNNTCEVIGVCFADRAATALRKQLASWLN